MKIQKILNCGLVTIIITGPKKGQSSCSWAFRRVSGITQLVDDIINKPLLEYQSYQRFSSAQTKTQKLLDTSLSLSKNVFQIQSPRRDGSTTGADLGLDDGFCSVPGGTTPRFLFLVSVHVYVPLQGNVSFRNKRITCCKQTNCAFWLGRYVHNL